MISLNFAKSRKILGKVELNFCEISVNVPDSGSGKICRNVTKDSKIHVNFEIFLKVELDYLVVLEKS